MKILSFVIPAYNSARYLEKCISSMLVPELLEQMEIIVVNDGSEDQTAEIAAEYSIRYPQTVRLISQENKGHGGALNTGCAAAQGKYIKVIDADDWVETSSLPQYIKALAECKSDVVLTHHRTIDISMDEVKNWRSYPEMFGKEHSLEELMAAWYSFDRSLSFHGITYRAAFYHEHGGELPEKVFYEDHAYAAYPCCHAKGILPLDLYVYNYRIGDANQSVAQENQLKRLEHSRTVLRYMIGQHQALEDGAGKAYAAMKTQGLLLSYLVTVLLVHPDRKTGRQLAKKQMEQCCKEIPAVYEMAEKKYWLMLCLNWLRIRKDGWDRMMNSGLYRLLRKKQDFR